MISLEDYAELCVLMSDTSGDESKEIAIARSKGVSADEWKTSKAAFVAKMSDPADGGSTALTFMTYYQSILEKRRATEPCTLELYTKIHAEMAFRKNPHDHSKKIDYHIVLGEYGYSHQTWLECENYWTPRVGSPGQVKWDPELGARFRELMQKESDRILGLTTG